MNISYSECVFLALVIQRDVGMCHIVVWPVRLYNIFPHYLTSATIFEKEVIELKMYIFIVYLTWKHFLF
jgi:hypothetical protein